MDRDTDELDVSGDVSTDLSLGAARDVLKEYWGHNSFRVDQERVLKAVFDGKDVLAVLPTGYGKSVCFQIPAILGSGGTLVISPLIALMKDQVDDCVKRGIPATYVNSHVDEDEQIERFDDFIAGAYKLLYVAPERIRSKMFLATIRQMAESADLNYLVVDEAHCASMWGHDFRPMYSRIGMILEVIKDFERPQVIAVTATATADIEADIASSLGMEEDYVRLIGDPVRSNIKYEVSHGNEWAEINRIARGFDIVKGRYVVYVGTRNGAQRLAEIVERQLYEGCVGVYHGGMRKAEREAAQEAFKDGSLPVIVATCAFGMGIDVPNIRAVVHFGIPGSIESYVQEAGRAGRDGEPSRAILLDSEFSYQLQEMFIEDANPSFESFSRVWEYLHVTLARPGEVLSESTENIARNLAAARWPINGGAIRTILNVMEKHDLVARAYAGSGAVLRVSKVLLQGVTGRIASKVAAKLLHLAQEKLGTVCTLHVDRATLASMLGMNKLAFSRALKAVEKKGAVEIERQFRGKTTRIKKWAVDLGEHLPREQLEEKRKRELARFKKMCEYVHTQDRVKFIRDYFQKGF